MAELLELAQLVQQHGVTQMQIRRGGIEAGLDPQRAPAFQALTQLLQFEDFIGATTDQGKGFFNGVHAKTPGLAVKNMNGVNYKLTTAET